MSSILGYLTDFRLHFFQFTQYIFLCNTQELNIILIWFIIQLCDNKRSLKVLPLGAMLLSRWRRYFLQLTNPFEFLEAVSLAHCFLFLDL